MTDLTAALLPKLKAHRLPGFDLGDDFVYPNYQGGSILNVASTLCDLFGVPEIGAPALMDEIHILELQQLQHLQWSERRHKCDNQCSWFSAALEKPIRWKPSALCYRG